MSQRRLDIDTQVKKLLANCKSEEEKVHRYLRIAQQYLYIEEHCEAERYLLRYIKAKPDSYEAHKLVGELYLKLRRYHDAYESLKSSYGFNESKEVLASLCQAAPHASIDLATKQQWLKKAEVANIPQISMLSLREAVLRESDASVSEMEDVLKERSTLYPLEPEAQVKLLLFYAEANRFEDCVKVILREENKQELRNSPQWYRECQNVLLKLRANKGLPYDQTLALLHLHIAQRLTFGLITDPFFIGDQDKGSVGLEPFFKQLERFDHLLDSCLTNKQWYREGLWSFVLDHFTGQLLFLFALGMLRRADESNREDTYKARGQALMFCALEYKPKKIGAESWFLKAKDDFKKLMYQMYLDGCYRTTVCFHCLANTSTDPGLADSVKIAVSGNSAVKFVTERLFPGRAIAAVYNQSIISRACTKLPDRATIALYEMNSCISFAGSLEHLVWLLLSGAELPTDKIFPSLPLVPNMIDGAHTPSQSDVDAFLSAVLAAVKIFGNKLDIIRPTVPREILHRAYTTTKQQNFWNAMYRTFVKKVTAGRDVLQTKKFVNDGLEIVRGKDSKKSMPVYYLVQIARDLRDRGHKKNAYFSAAVNYFKIVLSRLDEHPSAQPQVNAGGRSAPSMLFEFPKTMAVSEDAGGYRDEARLEIGKFLLFSGELENARTTLESVHNPMGYLFYAKTAKKLCTKLIIEGDVETGERLLEKAKTLLRKGMLMARSEPDVCDKLRAELESLEKTVSDTATTLGTSLNTSASSPKEVLSNQDVDVAKFEALIKEQTAKVLLDTAQRTARVETELAELKAMQTKLVETLAQVLAGQTVVISQTKSTVLANSEMVIKIAQLSQQLSRVEEVVNMAQAATDYNEYQDTPSTRSQQYQSGGLVIPPGAGLPQFNLVGVQHPSAQAYNATPAASRTTTTTPTPTSKEDLSIDLSTKILFDSEGTIYEKRPDGQFSALAAAHKICVLEMPMKNYVLKSLWYFDAANVYAKFDLNCMTYQTYELEDGQLNVQWTHGGKSYYIAFVDMSWQPGEVLRRILQSCGVPLTEPAKLSPVNKNSYLAAALNKSPTQTPVVDTSTTPPRQGALFDEDTKPFFATSLTSPLPVAPVTSLASTTSAGIVASPSPAAATLSISTPRSFSFSGIKATSSIVGSNATPVSVPAAAAAAAATTTTPVSVPAAAAANTTTPVSVTAAAAAAAAATTTTTTTPVSAPMPNLTSAFATMPKFTNAFASPSAPTVKSFAQGGFTFNTTPVSSTTSTKPTEVKLFDTIKKETPNPFSNFKFNIPKTENQSSSLGSWAASTTTTSPSKPLLGFSPSLSGATISNASVTSSVGTMNNDTSQDRPDEGDDYECTAQFQPVIALPSLVETKTGEENEEVKFSERARLYRFDADTVEWKERGVGTMKILRNQETGKFRVLMRRDQVLKLCANHQLIPGLQLTPRPKPTECMWAAPDFADGEQKNEQFVVRFKTKEQADKFKEVFEQGVKLSHDTSSSPTKPEAEVAKSQDEQVKSKTTAPLSLKDIFKPAEGSWTCSGCYMSNAASDAACPACASPNPTGGKSATNAAPSAGPGSTFKFGVPASEKQGSELPPLSSLFQPNPNAWNCSACLVSNASSVDECVACKSLRPGATKPKTSSPFKFGVGAAPASVAAPVSMMPPAGPSFSFATTNISTALAKPATGFVFGQGTISSTISAKISSGTPKQQQAKDQQQASFSQLSTKFTFGSPREHEFSFDAKHSDDDEDQVVESQDREFVPAVASLPPEISVVTGEEGLECLYSQKAKLFRFCDKEWKERGVGEFKILRDSSVHKVRLTMRREQVHKVCLNHYLTSDMKFHKRDDKSLEWQAVDFSEGELQPTLFAIRVRNREIATEMLDAIHNAQNEVVSSPAKPSGKIAENQKVASEAVADATVSQRSVTPVKVQSYFEDTGDNTQLVSSSNTTNDSIEVVREERASHADVLRARALLLPDHFFLYESRKARCKGCRGCEANGPADNLSPQEQVEEEVEEVEDASVKPKKSVAETSTNLSTEEAADSVVETSENSNVDAQGSQRKPVVFGAPSTFGTAAIDRLGESPLKPLAKSDSVPSTGFVFGTGTSMTFSSLAANATVGFNKLGEGKPWEGKQSSSFFSAFSKTAGPNVAAAATTSNESGNKPEDVDEVAPSDDVHFEPVIPMPELIKVETGEEQDDLLFSHKAKLYVFHADTNQWKERAIGNVKILRCADGRARIVIRRDMVHKVACNHYITELMELKPLATSNNSVTWTALDFAEGEPTPQLFALRMKGEVHLSEFTKIFKEEVQRAVKAKEDATNESRSETGNVVDDFEIVERVEHETSANHSESECDNDVQESTSDTEQFIKFVDNDNQPCLYLDPDDVLFAASGVITEEVPIGDSNWKNLGKGTIRVLYDGEIFAHVIYLSHFEDNKAIAETIIAVQTSLRQKDNQAIWMAQDTFQKPPIRRRFAVDFESTKDLEEFAAIFNEGKENAMSCGIVEKSDEPPWKSSSSPFC